MKNTQKILILITLSLVIGVFGLNAQEYGFMYLANKSASGSIATGTWHTVGSTTGNDFIEGATSSTWSFSSNRLTAGSDRSSKDTRLRLMKGT